MTGPREYDEDDIGTLYRVAEYVTDGTDRLEALGDDAPLSAVLDELDLLRTLFGSAYNHVTRMRNLMVAPYATWDAEHGQWAVDQARERVARVQGDMAARRACQNGGDA